MNAPGPQERLAHFLVFFFTGSLIALYGMVRLSITDLQPGWSGMALWIFQVSPLLACVPGVLRGNMTATMMMSLVGMLYFAIGVWTVMHPEKRFIGGAEIVFALGLFATSYWFMRERGRRLRAAAEGADGEA